MIPQGLHCTACGRNPRHATRPSIQAHAISRVFVIISIKMPANQELRQRRESLGIDLKEVAETLRIRNEYLKALEEGDIGRLPAAVYTRGYIREYAKYLDVDAGPLIEWYEGPVCQEPQPAAGPEPTRVAKSPLYRPFLWSAILVLVLLGAVVLIRMGPAGGGLAGSPEPAPRQEAGISFPPTAPGLSSSEKPAARYTLRADAVETTWLRVELDDGKAEEALLRPGESRQWEADNSFGIKIGNAGGVRFILNGKDLGAPGQRGRVLRVRLPSEGTPPGSTD